MTLQERLEEIEDRIDRACHVGDRARENVTLVAVSKTFSAEDIQRAYDLGLRDFGESRLQEAQPKVEELPQDIVWHFVGNLQSNKAKRIGSLFNVIHTLSKASQAREIDKLERELDGLVEVNIASEPQKAGLSLQGLDEFVEELIHFPKVRFRGLMTIGPALEDAEAMRPYFRAMREANERLGGKWLSMGMSADFDVAIQEGATHIRVGTALFGAR